MTDACNIVKSELTAGTWSNFGSKPNIYINNEDDFHGGNQYIQLSIPARTPIYTTNNQVIYYDYSCTLTITAQTTTIRNNLYSDIEAILEAADSSYTIQTIREPAGNKKHFEAKFKIQIL